jgi:Domain of unknown function (DUF4202)
MSAPEPPFEPADPERFEEALRRLDAENARDPNRESDAGTDWPRELLYARRLTAWVLKLSPAAPETLRLAARSQHLCRWEIPRDRYPLTRPGYLQWRSDLKKFHAQKAGEILRAVGYPEETVAQVQDLNLKKHFPADPDCCVLEDALCLVFLEFQLAELAGKTTPDKVVNAIQKSWKKMTPAGREAALKLRLGPRETALVQQALAG